MATKVNFEKQLSRLEEIVEKLRTNRFGRVCETF